MEEEKKVSNITEKESRNNNEHGPLNKNLLWQTKHCVHDVLLQIALQ